MDIINILLQNRLKNITYDTSKFTQEDFLLKDMNKIESLFEKEEKLKDIQEASKLLFDYIINGYYIIVAVDLDNDGISSGYIGNYCLKHIFNLTYDNYNLIISSRHHPRGFNMDMIEQINKKNIKNKILLITADMGTYDNNNYILLKNRYRDIKIIVTDHHQVPYDNYPSSVDYLINPQRKDNNFGKDFCGCCVFYLLLRETVKSLEDKEKLEKFDKGVLPYVASATLVDIMSISNIYNRYFVKKGISYLNQHEYRNFEYIKKLLRINSNITYKELSTKIGPLINTANRTSTEKFCLLGLITDNNDTSVRMLDYINRLNKQRKDNVSELLNTAIEQIDTKYTDSFVVIINSKLYISGNIASSLSGLYKRPSIVFLNNNSRNTLQGSGRAGIEGLDLLNILKRLPNDIVESANGHKGACGVSIYRERYEDFKRLFNQEVQKDLLHIKIQPLEPELVISQNDINIDLYNKLQMLAPYGLNWREPIITTSESFTIIDMIPIKSFYKIILGMENGDNISGTMFFSNITKNNLTFLNIHNKLKQLDKVKVYFNLSIFDNKLSLDILDIFFR